jgi:hypothetical protein
MIHRFLSGVITYYSHAEGTEGCAFSRTVLEPVRLGLKTEQREGLGGERTKGVLYIFPWELDREMPKMQVGEDFFVRGVCDSSEPPRDGSAFRVTGVIPYESVGVLKYVVVSGVANRGGGLD